MVREAGLTTTVTVPLAESSPSSLARVTTAVPAPTAVRMPSRSTVTTSGSLEV